MFQRKRVQQPSRAQITTITQCHLSQPMPSGGHTRGTFCCSSCRPAATISQPGRGISPSRKIKHLHEFGSVQHPDKHLAGLITNAHQLARLVHVKSDKPDLAVCVVKLGTHENTAKRVSEPALKQLLAGDNDSKPVGQSLIGHSSAPLLRRVLPAPYQRHPHLRKITRALQETHTHTHTQIHILCMQPAQAGMPTVNEGRVLQ